MATKSKGFAEAFANASKAGKGKKRRKKRVPRQTPTDLKTRSGMEHADGGFPSDEGGFPGKVPGSSPFGR